MAARKTIQGTRTRETILRAAANLASVEGLQGLTIGTLSAALGMSKSGLFAHFGSKEDLQLATIEAAREVYAVEVLYPALTDATGIARLGALCEAFLCYVERGVFPGGCFFAAAMAEFDCKPGPVRDKVAEMQAAWMHALEAAAGAGIDAGELAEDTDPSQLAFDLEAAMLGANWYFHLFSDANYLQRARHSVRRELTRAATASGRRRLPER